MTAAAARQVAVAPERIAGWLAGVDERHGAAAVDVSAGTLVLRCPDGARVEIAVPYPPLALDPSDRYGGLLAHALRERTVGLVLLRRGGAAVGVAVGPRLVASKVETRRVQGRTAAGGWSQQRYARRREQQAGELVRAAAGAAARTLLPYADRLDTLALGGDRLLLRDLLGDPRLALLARVPTRAVALSHDPRERELAAVAAALRRVEIAISAAVEP